MNVCIDVFVSSPPIMSLLKCLVTNVCYLDGLDVNISTRLLNYLKQSVFNDKPALQATFYCLAEPILQPGLYKTSLEVTDKAMLIKVADKLLYTMN